jgi:hypothetical protein
VAISARGYHSIGLKRDGTVVGVGRNDKGQRNVSSWKDIVDVTTSQGHTVGLKKDGTVVATGDNKYGQCNVSSWTDIVAISAGYYHTVGLKKDGTVVTTEYIKDQEHPYGFNGQHNVGDWTDVVAISACSEYTIGLKKDGTILATKFTGKDYEYKEMGDVSAWRNIVAITISDGIVLGIQSDGRIISNYKYGPSDWKLFNHIDTLPQEIEEAKREAEKQRIMAERRARNVCQYCGGEFKGMFKKACTKCGQKKDY